MAGIPRFNRKTSIYVIWEGLTKQGHRCQQSAKSRKGPLEWQSRPTTNAQHTRRARPKPTRRPLWRYTTLGSLLLLDSLSGAFSDEL